MMIRYEELRKDRQEAPEEPESAALLDEIADFAGDHVVTTQAQQTVMVLYPGTTHALRVFPAEGRVLFASADEQSGKTTAMKVTAALSANPVSAKGTTYGLQSALAEAANQPEQPPPTLYYDEISGVYGRSGLNRGGNQILDDILRDGYQQGATRKWSVDRVSQDYSIYAPFLMTGLRTAIPKDVRSRTIVITMRPGTPRRYFDLRESVPHAARLGSALGSAVRDHLEELRAFRALGIHPRLLDRRLEVWEPLFAVAWVLGGQRWLNRCRTAFMELALDISDQVTLSPRQEVIKDAAGLLETAFPGKGFISGLALAEEMRRLDNPLYQGRTPNGMARLIADAMPVPPVQERFGAERIRGYPAAVIAAAWERIRPADRENADLHEDENPFDVTADSADDSEPVLARPSRSRRVTQGTAGTAGNS